MNEGSLDHLQFLEENRYNKSAVAPAPPLPMVYYQNSSPVYFDLSPNTIRIVYNLHHL